MIVRAVAIVALVIALAGSAVAVPTPVTRRVLENGLTVLVKPEPGTGLVAIVALVKAGAAQESAQTAGIGNFVAQLLLAGTRLSSADDVAAVADEVGGNIGAQWHLDATEIRAVTTSASFNKAMSLIGECLTESNFEDAHVDVVRVELLKQIRAGVGDTFESAYDELRSLLYEDNGYRRPSPGVERVAALAKASDLARFYSAYYVPNNIVISIAGDVTVEQAVDRAEKAFAGIAPARLPINRGVPDETLDRGKVRASEQDVQAAYLMLGWLAPGVGSPDYPAMAVAANALGGGKGSLMFRELRQKRGMGYEVGTSYPKLKNQSHVIAFVITDPFKQGLPGMRGNAMLEEVKSALMEQVEALKTSPLADSQLRRAKGYTIGNYALDHQRLYERAFLAGWLDVVGLGHEWDRSFPDAVEKVTAEDVRRVARKYFTNSAAVLLLPKVGSEGS